MTRNRIMVTLGILLALPVIHLLVSAFFGLFMSGMAAKQTYSLWFHRNFGLANGTIYVVLAIVLACMAASVLIPSGDEDFDTPSDRVRLGAGIVLAVAVLLSSVMAFNAAWDNDKDEARFYNQATTFHVPDIKSPSPSLKNLFRDARQGDGSHCDLVGSADVPSCIKQGDLGHEGWKARVSSLDGAKQVMNRTSGETQNVTLSEDTITYLNDSPGQPARWSGIRVGGGIRQPMEGVVEWTGSGQPTVCKFIGDHAINRTFGGNRSNRLEHYLADRFPRLLYTMQDVWGYCSDGNPVVVIPVSQQHTFKKRTIETAAGILVVEGSPGGEPHITYKPTVRAGEYPGPVYPISIVAKQREDSSWAAGREFRSRSKFGYDPANSEAQSGNNSEYLLQGVKDGRMYWVTPLTPRGSSSELFVAYSVTPADEVTSGQLNSLDIYTLADDDPRKINIDNLDASAKNFIGQTRPGFFQASGKLIEFTPTDGDVWRAFGELNGRVIFRLDIAASNKVQPQLVELEGSQSATGQPVVTADNAVCGNPLPQVSQADLVSCLQRFANELASRQQQPAKPG